jgi:hypothetical protein
LDDFNVKRLTPGSWILSPAGGCPAAGLSLHAAGLICTIGAAFGWRAGLGSAVAWPELTQAQQAEQLYVAEIKPYHYAGRSRH